MKKRLVVILSSVTVIIACSYFITGKLIQQSYYDTVANLNTQPDVKVSLVNYDRGLFHSKIKLNVAIKATEIPLEQTITHGPVIVANTANGPRLKLLASQITSTLSGDWKQKLKQYTENDNALTIVTLIDLSKQANTWIKVAALDQRSQNDLHISWDQIVGEINHDLEFHTYKGTIKLPSFVINDKVWAFNLKDLAINIESSLKNNSFAHNNVVQTKTLSLAKSDNALIKLDDINTRFGVNNSVDGNLAIHFATEIANSQIAQQKFAQDNFKLNVNNINHAALRDFSNNKGLSMQSLAVLAQQLTANSTELTIELPKNFTEALLSYISFELYKDSIIGKYDKREDGEVLRDITASINNLIQGALKDKIFVEQGANYAFNMQPSVVVAEPIVAIEEPKA